MRNDVYEATFEDAYGREKTQIFNDGVDLRISLRGIDFTGQDFDDFQPIPEHLERARSLFTLNGDELCSCRLKWTMPLMLEIQGEIHTGALKATLALGEPAPNRGINLEMLSLELETPLGTVKSSGKSGWFDDAMGELIKALDPDIRIRSCLTCALSGYGYGGYGLFGGLACFRDARAEYLQVKGKGREAFFTVWAKRTEFVQETYLCPEYQPLDSTL